MSDNLIHRVAHAVAHQSAHQRKHGDHKAANGLGLIAFGIFTLPIPIIGIPLILMGIWKLMR